MPGPWDKYAKKPEAAGPWTKYAQPAATPPPAPELIGGGHSVSAAPPLFSKAGLKKAFFEGTDKGSNLLPAAGGIAGGLIGGASGSAVPGAGTVAGAVGGAALGGGAGEAGRQLIRRAAGFEGAPATSGEAVKNIGLEVLKQGAYELGGQGIGRMGKAIAPKLAEAAVAPGKRLLKSIPEDVNIGKTILQDSKGFTPKSVAKSLGDKIADHSTQLESKLSDAGRKGVRIPIIPARQEAVAAVNDAVQKNAPNYIKDAGKVSDQLTNQYAADGSIAGTLPGYVVPARARDLRQGVDLTIGNWNPENAGIGAGLRKRIYGKITDEIHSAVPGSLEHDAAMTRMIPAKEAAWNTSFNPGITRGVVEKLSRPTGALIGSAAGAGAGYKEGGAPGAIAGGAAGMLAPLAATSPRMLLLGARAADSQVPARLLRYSVPVIEGQMGRSKNKRPDDEEK